MSSTGRRRATAACATLALAVLAGGCGGSDKASDATAPSPSTTVASEPGSPEARFALLSADAATRSQKTAKMAFEVSGILGSAAANGEGGFDFQTKRGRFTMKLPVGQKVLAMEAVLDGLVAYVKYPPELAVGLGDKPWVKVDVGALGSSAGLDATLASAQSGDPSQALSYLQAASEDTTVVGMETLRGAEVTHYKTTLDLAQAAKSAPAESKAALEKQAKLLGDQKLPAEVWIDHEGRLRKLSYTVDLAKVTFPSGTPSQSGTQTTSVELFDFDSAVDASIPPPDQVTDLNQLLANLGR